MSELSINCFVLGGDSSEVFTVEIPKTKNVSILKRRIKEEQSHRLNHVDASELIAWKVSLPVDIITPELTVDDIETCQKAQLHSVKKVSSIFGETLVDEHVHILVQVPTVNQPVAAPDPTQFLSLNCFVLRVDEKPNQIFTVEIPKTKNVSILKDLIKKKKSRRLDHVDASDLILSQVTRSPYPWVITLKKVSKT
ncbi:hypothetical protein M378DRAFT_200960 [Amanita muscaria Koide BX008]|uniref:Crinkler effector protein N-terminal domain-containing protein n=1 Tax=Amanita muscaria (strain Koide BX008) TaxID=946122 RepID=A0A0C2WK95_AMAMK|nr:hypothetical protein M378DRAFT_200960 [Amanita muscaria Koide BX008]